MFKKILVVAFLFLISCAQREDDTPGRNNPFDSGSSHWTENSTPLITLKSDSLWEEFNHSCTTGSIRVYLQADDLNFPYDTLYGTIIYDTSKIRLPFYTNKTDTSVLLNLFKPNTSPVCTVLFTDRSRATTEKALEISVPAAAAPVVPSAKTFNNSQNTIIRWKPNPEALYYTLYCTTNRKGPYSDSIPVKQTTDTLISVADPATTNYPRYYILSVTGQSGRSRSTDTLVGRRYTADIPKPYISSISKGNYSSHIPLSISVSYSGIARLEIHRSENDTNSFGLIRIFETSGYSYVNFNDTVPGTSNYYYRVFAINKQGLCSFPSRIDYGYLSRLPSPNVSLVQYPDIISFKWPSITGAKNYRIYRSRVSCTAAELLHTTTSTVFSDTPATGDVYYYTFSAVDSKDTEGAKSSCLQAKITLLPQVDSFQVTFNVYPIHVALTWKSLPGAIGYLIYRDSLSTGYTDVPLDTVTGTAYNDSLTSTKAYYYSIAGFNDKGIGERSVKKTGSIIIPQIITAEGKTDSLSLRFAQNSGASVYYIYRSIDTTGYILIDSSHTNIYNAPLSDYTAYYYRYTVRTPEGVSVPSKPIQIVKTLAVPSGVIITEHDNGVSIKWNKVDGADSYEIYRSALSNSRPFYRAVTDTTFFDTLLTSLPRYYYSIAAKNSTVKSTASAAILSGIASIPLPPTSVDIRGLLHSINLSWSVPANSSRPDGFRIYRATDSYQFTLIGSTKSAQYIDSVPDSVRYYYQITAYNSKGESSITATYNAARAKPSAPGNLSASLATSKDFIRITWQPVSSITEYAVYRSLSPGVSYVYIGNVKNALEYRDSTCAANINYYYVVTSILNGNQSNFSTYSRGVRLGPPEVKEAGLNNPGITLTWLPFQYTIQRYCIYRSDMINGPYSKIDSTTQYSYFDKNGTSDSYYRISSINGDESDLSAAVKPGITNASYALVATQGTKTDAVELTWTPISGAFHYRIYRAPTDSFNRNIIRIAEVTTTDCIDSVHSDSIYYYKVTGVTQSGETGLPTEPALGYRRPYSKPLPPPDVYIDHTKPSIYIGWEEAPTTIGYNQYYVYRAPSATGPFEIIGYTKATTYLQEKVFNDIPPLKSPAVYYYFITTVNQAGESVQSEMVSASHTQ